MPESDLLPEPGEECLEVGVRIELGERRWVGHDVVEGRPRLQGAAHRVLLALDVVQLEQGGGVAEGGMGGVFLASSRVSTRTSPLKRSSLVVSASATIRGGSSWP